MELDRHGARPPDVIIATFSVGGFIFFGGMGGGHRMEKEIIYGERKICSNFTGVSEAYII